MLSILNVIIDVFTISYSLWFETFAKTTKAQKTQRNQFTILRIPSLKTGTLKFTRSPSHNSDS
ncbi:MAG: hypothetical protein AABZ43_03870, partial [Planctomycetota bacterium]